MGGGEWQEPPYQNTKALWCEHWQKWVQNMKRLNAYTYSVKGLKKGAKNFQLPQARDRLKGATQERDKLSFKLK